MKITRTDTNQTFTLDPHQVESLSHLHANKRAGLFLEMSLSKTVITLLYLYEMVYREVAFCRTLVVAPDKVARLTWPDEIKKWKETEGIRYSVVAGDASARLKALKADAEIFIIGVDNLNWLIDHFIKKKISKATGVPYGHYSGSLPFDSLVVDELSLFKGRGSQRFKKIRRALDLSEIDFRIGLTGTPAPNGLIDLWAQINIIDDGKRLENTFGKFTDKYFKTRGNGMIVYEYIPKPGTPSTINGKISDIVLTRKAEGNIELPELIIDDVEIELSPYDREIYESLEEEYVLEFMEADVIVKTPADLINKLLQVASGAIYDENKDWHELNTLKLDAIEETVERYSDDNFLIVYQFRHEVERLKARFPYARELPKGKKLKQTFDDWNDKKIKMLLIHPASAGHGLNMQLGGRRLLWTSPTWNLEHWLQTIARLRRRGSPFDKIYVHRFLAKGTRDMEVRKRVNRKDNNQNFLMREIELLRNKYYGKIRK